MAGGLEGGGERRTTARPQAPEGGREGEPTPRDGELGALLTGALEQLAGETGARVAAAWTPNAGRPALVARVGDAPPDPPNPGALEAVFASGGATDMGSPNADERLAEYAAKAGFAASAPLAAGEPVAAIFLGAGEGERPGGVRPRTLAALDHLVARLRSPAATAAAVERLAGLDDEVVRLTRLATVGDLLTEAVHEIRNPLVSVKTFLQLLPDNLDDRDFTENFRLGVIDEVRRMERLLDSLLQHARPGSDGSEDARGCVRAVLESVGRLLEKRAQEKQLRLVVDVGADLPRVAMGDDPLRQIVLNLALNAFEATPERGRVALSADADAGALRLTVDDEGPGVPPATRERLFDPFFSTRGERPVGLGLAVCRRLVDEVGGTIRVQTPPGGTGARFCVHLPIA